MNAILDKQNHDSEFLHFSKKPSMSVITMEKSTSDVVTMVLKRKKIAVAIPPLNDEELKVKVAELENLLPLEWKTLLAQDLLQPYFIQLKTHLQKELLQGKRIFPPLNQVFRAFECVPNLQSIKAVIIGQDPYFSYGQAVGLSFSVPVGQPIPSSLQNIFKELANDIPGFVFPKHGNLMKWAQQGVMLLNSTLTVENGQPNSHKDLGWSQFTDAVVALIDNQCANVVWMLWGAFAQKKASFVNSNKHKVLKSVHPSGLSASRGWFGSKHFSQCNAYLLEHGKAAIDWQV